LFGVFGGPKATKENFFQMLEKEDAAAIRAILKKDAQYVDSRNERDETPLLMACQKGNLEIAQALVEYEADINKKDESGWSPLHICASWGHKDLMAFLISKGAKVDVRTREGETPLHIAVIKGNRDAAKVLTDKGADINARTKDLKTPMHIAVQKDDINIARLLLVKGANVNAKDMKGQTPISMAFQIGNHQMVEFLGFARDSVKGPFPAASKEDAGDKGGQTTMLPDTSPQGVVPQAMGQAAASAASAAPTVPLPRPPRRERPMMEEDSAPTQILDVDMEDHVSGWSETGYVEQEELDEEIPLGKDESTQAEEDQVQIDEETWKEYADRGHFHLEKKEFELALSNFNIAMEIQPRNAQRYADRALAYIMMGRTSEALSDINRATELDPQEPSYYLSKAGLHRTMGNFQWVIQDCDMVMELAPFSDMAEKARRLIADVSPSLK
jgi:tetratricopeptide (TPR) repeat protein